MKIINTSKLNPSQLKPAEREWVYNGLDACITAEVLDVLLPQLDEQTSSIYAFSRALQGPVLDMRIRGVRIDQRRKAEVIEKDYNTVDGMDRPLERSVSVGYNFM